MNFSSQTMKRIEQDATSTTSRLVLYDRHYCRESDLLIKVNLKQVLPHQRQLQLISIDPELLNYPIRRITSPPELHRSIKEIKDDICDMLWNTLSISIRSTSFRLTMDTNYNGKLRDFALRDTDTIYSSIINWDKSWTCSEIHLTARPPIAW